MTEALGDINNRKHWRCVKSADGSKIIRKERDLILGWGKGEQGDTTRSTPVTGSQDERPVLALPVSAKKPRTTQGVKLAAAANHRETITTFFVDAFKPGSNSCTNCVLDIAMLYTPVVETVPWAIEPFGALKSLLIRTINGIPAAVKSEFSGSS